MGEMNVPETRKHKQLFWSISLIVRMQSEIGWLHFNNIE